MNLGQTVFSQLIEHLPHKEFQKCVARYSGDHALKSFSCWNQFLAMAFAQLTYRESLRDIEACLRFMQSKLYHMGFRGVAVYSFPNHDVIAGSPILYGHGPRSSKESPNVVVFLSLLRTAPGTCV